MVDVKSGKERTKEKRFGIECPICGNGSIVLQTENYADFIRRIRKCRKCDHIFYTIERIVEK